MSEGVIKYMGIDMVVGMVKIMCECYLYIFVVLYLDYGMIFESCEKVVKVGFIFVMIDVFYYVFEENLELIFKVVKMAYNVGVSVEVELGCLMGIEDNILVDEKDVVLVNFKEVE